MLAHFSIWPLDIPHMTEEVAEASRVLAQSGLTFQVGPMGTTVEGEWHDVMAAIVACHQVIRAGHQRVLTTITIDDDATRTQSMSAATAKVEAVTDNGF